MNNIKIDRKSSIPIYIQVKNQIMNEIKNGNLKVGDKMLTERDLAQNLNTSRNTISAAYNLLEQEGVLISYQGKGTFVAEESSTWKQENNRDKLLKIIDLGLEETFELGLDPKEYLALVEERIKEKEELMKKISAVFVECNYEQSREFAKELSDAAGVNVYPLVISDLEARNDKVNEVLKKAQLVIATFNHVNEVKELTQDINKEVHGIAINPSLEAIVKIARYPAETKFAFICLSEEFGFKVTNAMKSAGIDNLEVNVTTSKDQDELEKIISGCNVIIVSPGRRVEIKELVKGEKEVISFDYNIDQGSVKGIISKLLEIKKND